jgi:hypothetical protein
MSTAAPGDIVALADRMATLVRELEARRAVPANVVAITTRRAAKP